MRLLRQVSFLNLSRVRFAPSRGPVLRPVTPLALRPARGAFLRSRSGFAHFGCGARLRCPYAPMSLFIRPVGSLAPQQLSAILQLQTIGQAIANATEQLATEQRINSAADDPAGSMLVSSLNSELAALNATAGGLTQDSALVDTAASAAGQIASQLTQAASLATAVAGGTLTPDQVAANQNQLDQIVHSIDSLAGTTFNGRPLLDGSTATLALVIGANPASSVTLDLPTLTSASLGSSLGTLASITTGGANSLVSGNAADALNIINGASNQAAAAQASLGAFQQFTLGPASQNVANEQVAVTGALDQFNGVDVATVASELARNQLLQQATILSLEMFSHQQASLLQLLAGLNSKT